MLAITQSCRVFLGEGLIETLYFKNGTIHFIEQHWQRLRKSAVALGIPFSHDLQNWCKILHETLAEAPFNEGGLRCLLLAGDAERGLLAAPSTSVLDIQAFSYKRTYNGTMRLWSVPWRRDNGNPVYQHKSIQYLEQIQALRLAAHYGYDDALFCDMEENALETTTANILVWDGVCFHTPSKSQAMIPGVFLDALQKTLRNKLGYELKFRPLSRRSLFEMRTIWVCNSLRGLCPVACLDGEAIAFEPQLHEEIIRFLTTS